MFTENKEVSIKDTLTTLNHVNYQIAELLRIKEELESRANALFEHPEDCQKTYIFDKYKVTITSKYIYSLDKEEYAVIGNRLPPQFNPVKERISYDLDKKVIKDAEKYASSEEMKILSSFISKKEGKLHIKINAGV